MRRCMHHSVTVAANRAAAAAGAAGAAARHLQCNARRFSQISHCHEDSGKADACRACKLHDFTIAPYWWLAHKRTHIEYVYVYICVCVCALTSVDGCIIVFCFR